MGPISLRPTAGAGCARRGRPERQRATFNRRHGTPYVFGAYDVHSDRLRVRLKRRRRSSDMSVRVPVRRVPASDELDVSKPGRPRARSCRRLREAPPR
jgi:hypothetical protein